MFNLNKLVRNSLLTLFTGALLSMLFSNKTDLAITNSSSVLTITLILFIWLSWLYKKIILISNKIKINIIFLSILITFIIQILTIFYVHVGLFGDPIKMIHMASRLVNHNFNWLEWIKQYPNLVPLTSLYTFFFYLASKLGISFLIFFYSFNLIITISIIIIIIRLLWIYNKNISVLASILTIPTPFFYTFLLNVGYSDGLAILSSLIIVYIYYYSYRQQKISLILLFLNIFIFAIAYLMRPNILVMLIVFIIIGLLNLNKNKFVMLLNFKLFLSSIIGIVLASRFSKFLFKLFHYNIHNKDVFPIVHWIYMGLNPYSGGKYTSIDRYYTLHHYGFKTASQADIAGIIHRLSLYNPFTLLIHILSKFFTLWSSGVFQTSTDYQIRWQSAPKFFINHMFSLDIITEIFAKALISILLISIIIILYKKLFLKSNILLFSFLFIIGISLFHTLIWEVKTRYQFMTIGLLLLSGYISLNKVLSIKLISNYKKYYKYILYILPILWFSSIFSMSLIPNNNIISPVSSYRWAQSSIQKKSDFTTLKMNQSISQDITLNSSSSHMQLITEFSQPLTIYINKWANNHWNIILIKRISSHSIYKNIAYPFKSGKYRILLQNNSIYPAKLASAQNTYTTFNNLLASSPNSHKSTLVFTFWKASRNLNIYSTKLMIIFSILTIVTWLYIFNKYKKMT